MAILARACASEHLAKVVQRGWATAWRRYDAGQD